MREETRKLVAGIEALARALSNYQLAVAMLETAEPSELRALLIKLLADQHAAFVIAGIESDGIEDGMIARDIAERQVAAIKELVVERDAATAAYQETIRTLDEVYGVLWEPDQVRGDIVELAKRRLAERDAQRAEIAEAKADTELLDWLEQTRWPDNLVAQVVRDWKYAGRRYATGARGAIRAAIAQEKEK